MKKKYGFMMLMVALIVGLAFCFSSGLQGVAKAEDEVQMYKVYIDGGSYTLSEGTISGATENQGCGIYAIGESTFTMSGGEITNNMHGVMSLGEFTMDGGTIYGNSGIGVGAGGNFNMNDGKISNNIVGVAVATSANFTMKKGTISNNNNTIDSYIPGGGVYLTDGSFTMIDGIIADNKCKDSGGGGVEL